MIKDFNAHVLVVLAVFLIGGSFIASNALMGSIDEFAFEIHSLRDCYVLPCPFYSSEKTLPNTN